MSISRGFVFSSGWSPQVRQKDGLGVYGLIIFIMEIPSKTMPHNTKANVDVPAERVSEVPVRRTRELRAFVPVHVAYHEVRPRGGAHRITLRPT